MIDSDDDTCGCCRFYIQERQDDDDGLCRRYPPRVFVNSAGEDISSMPEVYSGWWCGEFSRRTN